MFDLIPISERLVKYEFMLTAIISDNDLIHPLAEFGFTLSVVEKGQQIYNKASTLYQNQKREYADKHSATEDYRKTRKEAYENYLVLVKLSRIALKKTPILLARLDLLGKRGISYDKLVGQMENFYKGAMKDLNIQEELKRFNITIQRLKESKDLFEEMKDKQQFQKNAITKARQATKNRNAAIKILDDWMKDLIAVARIVFADEPYFLKQMGITGRS